VATLTFGQLEQLWIANGGDPAWAPTMAGIALFESGGNPASNNYTDNHGTQTSWGLWQISDGTHNMPVPNMNDPNVNAQQAVVKLGGGKNIGAWAGDAVGQQAVNIRGPLSLAQVEKTIQGGGFSTSDANAGLTGGAGVPSSSTTAAAPVSQNVNTGAITYTPSVVPGVPASAPSLNPLGLNPISDLGSVIQWGVAFSGWAIFIVLVFLFGSVLLLLGLAMLVVLFASPAAGPIAGVVAGRTPVGRLAGAATGAASSARTKSATRSYTAERRSQTLRHSEERHSQSEANRAQRAGRRATRSLDISPTHGRRPTASQRASWAAEGFPGDRS